MCLPLVSKRDLVRKGIPEVSPVAESKRNQLTILQSMQIEKKSSKNISTNPKRKEINAGNSRHPNRNKNQLRQFPNIQIEKKSIKNVSNNPNGNEID